MFPVGVSGPVESGPVELSAAAGVLVAQNWAQSHLPATRAAVIMTTEPVWASIFAVLVGGETLSDRLLVGGPLVLVAMALAEIPLRRGRRGFAQRRHSDERAL